MHRPVNQSLALGFGWRKAIKARLSLVRNKVNLFMVEVTKEARRAKEQRLCK